MMFLIAATAIPLFYVPGLMWGQQTHLSMAEYWRWWVVHLWVEGFFEVFATVVMAFLFTRMGLITNKNRNGFGIIFNGYLLIWWDYRDVPPLIFQWNTNGSCGLWSCI